MTLVGSFVLLKLISYNDIMWPFFFKMGLNYKYCIGKDMILVACHMFYIADKLFQYLDKKVDIFIIMNKHTLYAYFKVRIYPSSSASF